jgi:predicted nucleic acid-binding protein
MSLVLDTGPLLALLDANDPAHQRCVQLLRESREEKVIPAPVLPELAYWLGQGLPLQALITTLDNIVARAFRVEDLQSVDYVRVREICVTYADSPVGFVDAAVLAVVERLNEPKLATLDHRHFRMMRPRHVESLTLLPE